MEWLKQQGPWAPGLVNYLERHHQQYDVLVFFTYLYATTVMGIRVAPSKSLLVPTAHDEPALRLGIYEDVFASAILATEGNQGDKVDYALIGNFPNQSGFLDDLGFGQGLEGTIKLVEPGVRNEQQSIPLDSTVLAFGAPSEFTYEITGTKDRGPSGIPGQVAIFDPNTSSPLPIFREFDLEVGQTATIAVTTTRDLGTMVKVVSDGSAPWSHSDSSR